MHLHRLAAPFHRRQQLGTCELLGLNPIEYLSDILPRLARGVVIARDIPAMLPSAWMTARAA